MADTFRPFLEVAMESVDGYSLGFEFVETAQL